MSTLICFNKPFGVLCQFSGAHPNLADFIDQPKIYPAGRLDKDSEGLLLLTDDGRLQARISNPRFKIPKTYWAQVEGIPGDDALQALAGGILIGGRQTRPARAARIPEPEPLWARDPPVRYRRRIPDCWLTITLREGRNRQVRRMTAAVGHPCLRLVRVAVGPWRLGDLEPGAWRFDAPGALDANPAGPRRSS